MTVDAVWTKKNSDFVDRYMAKITRTKNAIFQYSQFLGFRMIESRSTYRFSEIWFRQGRNVVRLIIRRISIHKRDSTGSNQ